MTSETERPEILQPALASALDHRDDMVGGPGAQLRLEPWELLAKHLERAVPIRVTLQNSRVVRNLQPGFPQQAFEGAFDPVAIDPARGAEAPITIEDLLPQITRIAPESMLVNAVIATETPAPFRNLGLAPPAPRPAVRPFGELLMVDPSGTR